MAIPGIDAILNAADLISEIRRALSKIETLEKNQRDFVDDLRLLDRRVREVEARMVEVRVETKFEAVREAQTVINSVQGNLYGEIKDLAVKIDRIEQASFRHKEKETQTNVPNPQQIRIASTGEGDV